MPYSLPTYYRGIRFRSRLEARWAAFFDLLDWAWEYEPFDLDGYIPDFVMLNWAHPLIVEVKPATKISDLNRHRAKIEKSGWDGDAMIVGVNPQLDARHNDGYIGIISQGSNGWGPAVLAPDGGFHNDPDDSQEDVCDSNCLFSEDGGWTCYRCGIYCKWNTEDVSHIWAEARNAVQWRGE